MTSGSFVIPVPRARGLPILEEPPPVVPGLIDYPKIWAVRHGSRCYTEDNLDGVAEREHLSKFHGVSLGMYSGGPWDRGDSGYLSRAEVAAEIKAFNPDCVLTDYTDLMETGLTSDTGVKCSSEQGPGGLDWWIYKDADDGINDANRVTTFGTSYNTNITHYVTPDSNGQRLPQWFADKQIAEKFVPHLAPGGIGVGPNGMNLYVDVYDIRPRTSVTDMDGDGRRDNARSFYDPEIESHMIGKLDQFGNPEDPRGYSVEKAQAWRAGQRDYVLEIKAVYPDILFIANLVTWPRESLSFTPTFNLPFEYVDIAHGGQLEGMSLYQPVGGNSFPFSGVLSDGTVKPGSSFGSFQRCMGMYYVTMDYCVDPKYVMTDFHISALPENEISIETGTDRTLQNNTIKNRSPAPGSGTPFHLMRWGLTMTLMNNGFFNNNVKRGYSGASHYDEFGTTNSNTTGLNKGYLRQPVDPPPTSPDPSDPDLWWRKFEGGWAIANASHTRTITVPLSVFGGAGNGIRINGFQDPNHNDGTVVTGPFQLGPIDGIIILENN
jgi:hypothetical protein